MSVLVRKSETVKRIGFLPRAETVPRIAAAMTSVVLALFSMSSNMICLDVSQYLFKSLPSCPCTWSSTWSCDALPTLCFSWEGQ